ncbi:MAG: hypothetical protein HYV08_07000 [Deltaproteobacteria bacterium]|nr:hypothetical protein [Deltaproteobacteria bacterium]
MPTEEKTFLLRFSLSAELPDEEESDDEAQPWLQEWEQQIKPALLKTVFAQLRAHPGWKIHVRNRGIPAEREVEIVMQKVPVL